MSTTSLMMVPHSLTSLQLKPRRESKTVIFKYGSCFLANQGLKYLSNGLLRAPTGRYSKMDFAVCCGLPGVPLPSPSDNWQGWILGAVVTIILPFFRHKWGPLLNLTQKVDAVVDTVDHVAEVIEKVSEEVGRVADEVADQLPEGGKLKNALEFVENAAKNIAKDAHVADQILDKIDEVEEQVESFLEQGNDQANEKAEPTNDQANEKVEPVNDQANEKAEQANDQANEKAENANDQKIR